MHDESFEFGWNDEDETRGNSPVSESLDALEQWLKKNHRLWQLGLSLAATAQHYRRDYQHIPFNKSGWYSPN